MKCHLGNFPVQARRTCKTPKKASPLETRGHIRKLSFDYNLGSDHMPASLQSSDAYGPPKNTAVLGGPPLKFCERQPPWACERQPNAARCVCSVQS